jgi:hypothetical protein
MKSKFELPKSIFNPGRGEITFSGLPPRITDVSDADRVFEYRELGGAIGTEALTPRHPLRPIVANPARGPAKPDEQIWSRGPPPATSRPNKFPRCFNFN